MTVISSKNALATVLINSSYIIRLKRFIPIESTFELQRPVRPGNLLKPAGRLLRHEDKNRTICAGLISKSLFQSMTEFAMFQFSRAVFCLLLLLTFVQAALSQTSSQTPNQLSTASVSGVVKLGEAPAVGISLALLPDQGGRNPQQQARGPAQNTEPQKTTQAVTNDKGQYVFSNVPAGRFRVMLLTETLVVSNSNAGSNADNSPGNNVGNNFGNNAGGNPGGAQRTAGIAVTVSEGQAISQIDFALAPGGVITGQVSDHEGRPVIAQRINLMTVAENAQIRPFNGGNRFGYETDDRGVYRIYGLPAGRYLVSVGDDANVGGRPGQVRQVHYPKTYYPDATDQAQAQPVEVQSGGAAESIDIRMGTPLKTYAVSGRAVDADTGEPVPSVPISVSLQRGQRGNGPQVNGPAGGSNNNTTDGEGKFRITGLLPGKYAVTVSSTGLGNTTPSDFYNDPASFEISSDETTGVEVKVHRGASISGIVLIEGAKDPSLAARLPQIMITANSRGGQGQGQAGRGASGRQSAAQVSSEGTFRISGLAPGTVRLNMNSFGGPGGPGGSSNGFSLIRIERNGSAINGDFNVNSGEQVTGVRVVVGVGSGVISGTVIFPEGPPPAGTTMMVTTRSLDSSNQIRPVEVSPNGQFRITGLLSGSYEVRLNVISGGFGNGQQRGGGQPSDRQRGAGQRGGGQQQGGGGAINNSQARISPVTQTVNVVNGSETSVRLNLPLSQQ